ncbi:MAG: pyruvate kinase [Parcubacteria bacterium C7867-008]|nr:MAG: pyruvate kinase [Parcubacteria bacterium C7867-008]
MEQRKYTKIVATIGPKTESEETLSRLIQAGMNVMRLNMSHGDQAEHGARIVNGRAAAEKLGEPIGILMDLSGPKIRTGMYETERITIENGAKLTLTTEEAIGTTSRIYVNYRKLPQEVKPGSVIMLDDGKKKLVVDSIEGTEVHCTVVVGGELKARRGVNIPGAYLTIDTITEKDRDDLAFGIKQGIDMVALSFVRRPEDITELREILKTLGAPTLPIISKIETQEAIDNLDAIITASDGIMVARGDLAIEIPAEQVPRWQKEMIRKSNEQGKPVITATQLLESMITSPVPTRAEVSDVANAVFDGTDAVMLSEESTLGAFPVEAVETLARVARASEAAITPPVAVSTIPDTVTHAVARAAEELNAKAIVALTESGTTARITARFHPHCPVIALTPSESTRKSLALSRGVYPYTIKQLGSLEETLAFIPGFLMEKGYATTGDTVLVTAGLSFGVAGSTNLLVAITL